MQTVNLFIGGDHCPAASGKRFERSNPITGEVATSAAAATVEDATRAADVAAAAFAVWSATPPGERRRLLLAAAQALLAAGPDITQAMKEEIGATDAWAGFNVKLASDMLVEAASLTTQIKGEIIPSNRPGTMAMALRQPAGVVLSIAPWNAPVILGVRSIATPLACGNTVVMKTSELCPRTHALIIEAIASAGLPKGVLNAVSNAPEDAAKIVETLIAHPAVRRVNFTGSTRVGRVIAETAGRYLKPALLELGGKAPFIVLDDADIDAAVAAAAFGAYMNQGQICMSTERIIVVEAVADAFAEKFAAKVASMATGDPREGKTPLGAVVDRKTVDHVNALIEDALAKGAQLLTGGMGESVLMPATVVAGVTSAMNLYRDESFGPVVALIRARDEDHAVEIANDSEYGLSAAVFTRDTARGLGVARRIRSGICHVNGPTVHDEAQMPFGGVGASGYGRFGGRQGIDSFTETRWITMETQPGHFPI